MKYVLDTNVISALMKGETAAIAHLKRLQREDVLIPQPVVAEIEYGLQRLPRSRRRDELTSRFELLKSELGRAIWSDEVSAAFGQAKADLERRGEKIEDFDVAVAAHAIAPETTLVTANLKHLARIPGIKLANWSR